MTTCIIAGHDNAWMLIADRPNHICRPEAIASSACSLSVTFPSCNCILYPIQLEHLFGLQMKMHLIHLSAQEKSDELGLKQQVDDIQHTSTYSKLSEAGFWGIKLKLQLMQQHMPRSC